MTLKNYGFPQLDFNFYEVKLHFTEIYCNFWLLSAILLNFDKKSLHFNTLLDKVPHAGAKYYIRPFGNSFSFPKQFFDH